MPPVVPAGSSVGKKNSAAAISRVRRKRLLPVPPDQEAGEVIAHELPVVGEDAVEGGLALNDDAGLLMYLASNGLIGRLPAFDPAARQNPARRVAMLDEQHFAAGVDHHRPDAERRPSRQPEPGMQREARNHSEKCSFCH